MPTILCAMSRGVYERMMTPALEAELYAMGEILDGRDAERLSEEEYGALWAQADAALTGWGVRPPTPEMVGNPPRVQIVCHTAGSVKMFPRELIERGVVITTMRAVIARTVAEFCLMNACILLRRYLFFVDSSPERKAFFGPETRRPLNETLFDKTVGIVGFGYVGRALRGLLVPFGCRVLVHDPYLPAEAAARHNVESVDLPTLLRESKVISLHAPDIPETQGMIGAKELELLQDGAILLNSARGRLIDTEALTAALRTGRFFAAIDVTDPEPLPPNHPLRTLPNVLFTPHVAGPTLDEYPRMARTGLDELARFFRGEPPLYPVSLHEYDLTT